MIAVRLDPATQPDLQVIYLTATVQVMGVPVNVHLAAVSWRHPGNRPSIHYIGTLDGPWRYHVTGHVGHEVTVFRAHFSPYRIERYSLAEWLERRLALAPSEVFGWEAPPAPVGVARG